MLSKGKCFSTLLCVLGASGVFRESLESVLPSVVYFGSKVISQILLHGVHPDVSETLIRIIDNRLIRMLR